MKLEYILIWYIAGLAYTYWSIYIDKFDRDGIHIKSRDDFHKAMNELVFMTGEYGALCAFFLIATFAPIFIPFKIIRRTWAIIGHKSV